ncbi:hypothetical protein PsorP6_007199 [Peronosclerospora sorghi]|uniref:Uncharacterized protein n=1 Tax=Peronosclerospora sorghi TaxID=230839 RepID=A0ACC0WD82_9STRA|nr:hypothetical protein PsorP6_007199 [Peronosclerospora sorghi]
MPLPETSTTVAVLSTAASVGLALYALKLRTDAKPSQKGTDPITSHDNKQWIIEELIATRRSVFPLDYDRERHVPRDVLLKMLESANWAPTHGRTEPWRFVVFDSPEKRLELGQFIANVYKKAVPVDKFLEKKYEKMVFNCTASSYVVAICMKRQKSGKIPEWEEMCAVACAIQNMHLVATAYNIGAYWSSGPPITMSQEMKEYLKLDEADKCLGLFYMGVPQASAIIAKGSRKPIQDKVTWISA